MSNGKENNKGPVDLSPSATQSAAWGLGAPLAGTLLGALLGGKKHRLGGGLIGGGLGVGAALLALEQIQKGNMGDFLLEQEPDLIRRGRNRFGLSADAMTRKERMSGLQRPKLDLWGSLKENLEVLKNKNGRGGHFLPAADRNSEKWKSRPVGSFFSNED